MKVSEVHEVCMAVKAGIEQVIVGHRSAVDQVLIALLGEGHILIEDVPGVGKTMLARAVATTTGCAFGRIQCTPDLLPSDVTGVSVYDERSGEFTFRPGPVVSQIVLADEINRATPRTQSSLLECMAERQVTVDGTSHQLPRPFMLFATQNPIEFEGTFPLPEAQLDRFFLRISLGYPSESEEMEIVRRLEHDHPIENLTARTSAQQILKMQQAIKEVRVEESLRAYVIRLVQATRTHPDVSLGSSPRGTLALFRASQARAALNGRDYVIPDDIKGLAEAVLAHRIVMKPESRLRGKTGLDVLREVIDATALDLTG